MNTTWQLETIPIRSRGWDGKELMLQNVPVYRNKNTKKVKVILHELAKAELVQIAETVGIEPRDVPLFLLFHAPAGPWQSGYLFHKYRINKMLFYQWKGLEKLGLGEAYPRDEFVAKENGPIPKELGKDLRRLQKLGLLDVGAGEANHRNPRPTQIRLTPLGQEVAHEVWHRAPLPYRDVTQKVKERLLEMTPSTLKRIVHREFPEYREKYSDLDEE